MKKTILFYVYLFFSFSILFGQEIDEEETSPDTLDTRIGVLFKSKDTFIITITADMAAIVKDRDQDSEKFTAALNYISKKGKEVKIPIKVQARGNFRKLKANCDFPPLWVDFGEGKKSRKKFKYQNDLKLVTHCVREDYVLREYAVYKVFNAITKESFKARLALITYVDTQKKRDTETRLGYFIEAPDELGLRNDMVFKSTGKLLQTNVDSFNMATASVFEYMIGNSDWSVPAKHNITVFATKNRKLKIVPYDFDHSGLVDAKYAKPSPKLPIQYVTDRIYRGITYPEPLFLRVFDLFKSKKDKIYKIYNDLGFDAGYKKSTIKYLDEFYKELEDPKKLIKNFSATALSYSK